MYEDIEITFGKYKYSRLSDLDDGYLNWMLGMVRKDPYSFIGEWASDNQGNIEGLLRARQVSKIEAYSHRGITLSASQQAAVDSIDFCLLQSPDNHHMRLQGGAGYGKSFTTNAVVMRAVKLGFRIRACATSYVATQVLRQNLDVLGIECGTIASTLRLKPTHKGANETYEFTPDTYEILPTILGDCALLIVDEYSMVEDTIAQALLDHAVQYGGKLLVVGDGKQLPSPAQNWDSCLDKVEPSVTLTTPMRYSVDSTLYRVEQLVREDPYAFRAKDFVNEAGEVSAYSEWEPYLAQFLETYRANPELDVRMLWYKRQNMVDANKQIRNALFDHPEDLLSAGEQLRVQRTTDIPDPADPDGDKRRFYSGTHFRVDEVGPHVARAQGFDIPCLRVRSGNNPQTNVLFSVTEGHADPNYPGGLEFNAALSTLAEECTDKVRPWKDYRAFRDSFLQVAYSYATTVHRTQGMSADMVFVSPGALKQAKAFDAQRLLYVGLTRAKTELHCLGD